MTKALFTLCLWGMFSGSLAIAEEAELPSASRFVSAAREGDLVLVRKWLRMGMDANTAGASSESALHAAVSGNRADLARYLLDSGAEVDTRDRLGRTPLLLAVEKNAVESVRVLLTRGPELDCRDMRERTPLLIAVQNQNFFLMKKLLEEGARANISDKEGNSALHLAVRNRRPDFVKTLLAYGADPTAVDLKGRTPLHFAALQSNAFSQWVDSSMVMFFGTAAEKNGEAVISEWEDFSGFQIAKRLLSEGAGVDTRDLAGRTALREAARQGRIDLVQLLLEKGADPALANEKNPFSQKTLEEEIRGCDFPRIKALLKTSPGNATPKPGTLIK